MNMIDREALFIEKVQNRFKRHPKRFEQVRRYFGRSIASVQGEVIGVRGEGVLRVLEFLSKGSIPVHPSTGTTIRQKEIDGYYLAPLPMHPVFSSPDYEWVRRLGAFFGRNPDPKNPRMSRNRAFYEDVERGEYFAEQSALAEAVLVNAPAVLKPRWRNSLMKLVERIDETVAEVVMRNGRLVESDGPQFESFLEHILGELEDFDNDHTPDALMERDFSGQYPYLNAITRGLVRKDINQKSWLDFILPRLRKSKGVLIGFNEGILQGPIARGIVNYSEIIIMAENGQIDLSRNPISAIEPLGEYEDKVLAQIGL